jgi:hypothetical protein
VSTDISVFLLGNIGTPADVLTVAMVDAKETIEQWRRDLDGESYVGTPKVQDRLLALWGDVGEQGTRVVEQWLAITPHRNLFSADELRAMLDEVDAILASPALPA